MSIPHERTPVTDIGDVWIDGRPYRATVVGGDISNMFARKVNQGDPTADDHPIFTTSAQRDWSGGWMVLNQNPASDTSRFWASTAATDSPETLTLPAFTHELTAPNGEDGTPYMIGDFLGLFYVCWGTTLYAYNTLTQAPTLIGDMGSNAINKGIAYREDKAAGRLYLWIPLHSGYCTVRDDLTLEQGTAANTVVAFEVWDQKLWRLEGTGDLSWVNAFPDVDEDWQFDCAIPDGSTPRNLIQYLRMDGEPCLFVVSNGLTWKHDFTNNTLHVEDLWFPPHPYHGLASIRHQSDVLVSAGTGIYTYDNNTISPDNGLDSRNGLPPEYRGFVASMASGLNDIFILVQGETDDAPVVQTMEMKAGIPDTRTLSPQTAKNVLLRRNMYGVHYVWAGEGGTPTNVLTSKQQGIYSLWWGCNDTLYMQQLPATYFNPDDPHAVKLPMAKRARHYTSWNDWGRKGQPKIMKMIEIETSNLGLNGNKVLVWYRTDDYEAPPILLGEVTTNGEQRWFLGQDPHEPTLPNGRGHYKGLRHERWQLIFDLERGDDPLSAPIIRYHQVVARQWLRPQDTFRLRLDLTAKQKDYPVAEQYDRLRAAAEAQEAVVFQWNNNITMVELVVMDYSMGTGKDERAQASVTLVESFEKSLEV